MNFRKTHLHAAAATVIAALVGAVAPGAAFAQAHPWTTIGSAGVVDDNDTGIVEFVNGEARTRAAAAAGSVLNLRYNVVSLEGFSGPGSYTLRVHFRDNGGSARMQLNLRRYNHTGTTSQVYAFDSNIFPAAVGYQTRERCINVNWDFDAGAYFFDATLTKSGAAGTPALGTIQLIRLPGICPNFTGPL